jgi:ribosomal protein L12E/L44/L45/RPP1/RPP2
MQNTTPLEHVETLGSVVPAITWLNMTGDVTITWDESNREQIVELVKQKMKQGYSFFILKPRAIARLGNKKIALKDESQLKDAIGVVVPDSQVSAIVAKLGDPEVETVVKRGAAVLTLVPKTQSLDTTKRAETAEEVVEAQSVAVRPIVGG